MPTSVVLSYSFIYYLNVLCELTRKEFHMTGIIIRAKKLQVGSPQRPKPKTFNIKLTAKFV